VCGIFGFALKKPLSLTKVFKVLERLEVHRYPNETKPVGGYGAGLAVLRKDGSISLEKTGKTDDVSPARRLSRMVKVEEAAVLVAHVRMPSPQFMENAHLKETAQPYLADCRQGLTVVSAHNGYITNYKVLRKKLGEAHVLESEKVRLIDSEVIPHIFEKILEEKKDTEKALSALHAMLRGSMALSLLQIQKSEKLLHLVHSGKTRGLTIWTNAQNEVIFCSRKEPLIQEFKLVLDRGKFKENITIPYNKNEKLQRSFALR